ncbi:unnamed protein product [Adineta ricciae]|uniref:Uncharacterized protein n=1 Tax=Adineta ricciae TaxID=249248 RepID=A0A815FCZ7_ADIRI|nr:unnamed protein product [Adineta ricciae]
MSSQVDRRVMKNAENSYQENMLEPDISIPVHLLGTFISVITSIACFKSAIDTIIWAGVLSMCFGLIMLINLFHCVYTLLNKRQLSKNQIHNNQRENRSSVQVKLKYLHFYKHFFSWFRRQDHQEFVI